MTTTISISLEDDIAKQLKEAAEKSRRTVSTQAAIYFEQGLEEDGFRDVQD